MRILLSAILFCAFVTPVAAEVLSGNGWRMTVTRPAGKSRHAAVILLPGCSGNSPPEVAAGLVDHAARLNRRGYAAGILDVLGPRGRVSICADAGALRGLERAAATAATAAAHRLAADPGIDARRIAFLGQSFGGSVALRLASPSARGDNPPFAAIIAYYPWCEAGYGGAGLSDFDRPVLIMAGANDQWTPVARCRALRPTGGSRRAEITVYAGAYHSFDLVGLKRITIQGVGGAFPVEGNRVAARQSQERYLDFLAAALRQPPSQ